MGWKGASAEGWEELLASRVKRRVLVKEHENVGWSRLEEEC